MDVEITDAYNIFLLTQVVRDPELYPLFDISLSLFSSQDSEGTLYNEKITLSTGPFKSCYEQQYLKDPDSIYPRFIGRFLPEDFAYDCCAEGKTFIFDQGVCAVYSVVKL